MSGQVVAGWVVVGLLVAATPALKRLACAIYDAQHRSEARWESEDRAALRRMCERVKGAGE